MFHKTKFFHYFSTSLFLTIFILLIPSFASGCDCGVYFVPESAVFTKTDAVFAGKVISVKEVSPSRFVARLKVIETFKGNSQIETDVHYFIGDCSVSEIALDKIYIVYADFDSTKSHLKMGICTITRMVSNPDVEFKPLREFGKKTQIVVGLDLLDISESEKVSVFATRNGISEKAIFDKNLFTIDLIEAGTYAVTIKFLFKINVKNEDFYRVKKNANSTTINYSVSVKQNEIEYEEIRLGIIER